ncbi:MAG: DNA-processing protein DprA [Blautia sp.]|nr:DNA-processing protein DprA [Blautia sp.]MDY3999654.1 DNA-processing protein DprA [Blautia sp.]
MEGTDSNTIRCIDYYSGEYPEKLRSYQDMPKKLYVRGKLPVPGRPAVAIVGARMCSAYGRMQAFRFARELSMAGIQIISGMAYGIDSEGHKGALEGGSPTFAVLGNGVDICYPSGNRPLYERILREDGGILSEYPPGTMARNYFFPARNRIISALSDIVLVVEAKEKSGSLITASHALEQGKSVFAVPGPVTEELSRGCHKLIYDGAGIAYSPEILLEECGILRGKSNKSNEKKQLVLATDLNLVYSCLDLRPKSPDDFIRETGLSPGKVNNLLLELELMGLAREEGRHHYVKQDCADSS